MKVLKCGTRVKSVIGEVDGIITGVSIRRDSVSYEVSYYCEGEHRSAWVYEEEIRKSKKEKEIIKFY